MSNSLRGDGMKYPKVKFDVKPIVRLYKAGKNVSAIELGEKDLLMTTLVKVANIFKIPVIALFK
jgi:hypothetical protein